MEKSIGKEDFGLLVIILALADAAKKERRDGSGIIEHTKRIDQTIELICLELCTDFIHKARTQHQDALGVVDVERWLGNMYWSD